MRITPMGLITEGVDENYTTLIYPLLFGTKTGRPTVFSTGTKYNRGNLILHNGKIYGAKRDDIIGPFNEDDWYEISLIEARGIHEVDLNNLIVSSLLSL